MIVLDASIAGPMVLADEPGLPAWIAERLANGPLWAPVNWPLECMSMLHVAEIRRRIDRKERLRSADQLRRLPVVLDTLTNERAWTATSQLADEHTLTIYDAGYLELALRMGAALATLDGDLRDAALARGLEVLTYP